MGELVVEVLGRHGVVSSRHRLSRFPAYIGRGYRNDIVLDDRRISASHLEVHARDDGRFSLKDLASKTGTFLVADGREEKIEQIDLDGDRTIRIGGVALRFRDPSFPVEATIQYEGELPSDSWLERSWSLPVLLVATLSATAIDAYLGSYKSHSKDITLSVLAFFVFLVLWSGAWSVASKISRQRTRFLAHGAIASCAIIGLELANVVPEWIAFACSSSRLENVLNVLLNGLLLWWVLFRHLRLTMRAGNWRLRIGSGLVAWGVVFLILVATAASAPEFDAHLSYPYQIKLRAFRIAPAHPPEDVFTRARALKDDVDALSKLPVPGATHSR